MDDWEPSVDAPQSSWRPAIAAACVIAAATAFCFVSVPGLNIAEQVVANDWHPQIEQPPKQDLRRQQQTFPGDVFGPYPVPASVSGWQPQTNHTIFDQKRLQYNYPYLFYVPLTPLLERVSLDKFHPPIEQPQFDQKRTQSLSAGDFHSYIPPAAVSADRWHPEILQPRFDSRRQQQTFPEQALAPFPIPASVSGWQPEQNQPLFGRQYRLALYPSLHYTEAPTGGLTNAQWIALGNTGWTGLTNPEWAGSFGETIFVDKWLGVDPPYYGAKRQQAIYPSEFRGDVPRTELVSADRWHPLVEQPRFDARRQQAIYPCESRNDIAGKETITADDWLPLANQPLFDQKRQQAVYPVWTADQLPRLGETILADKWHPLANQPLYDQKRLQYFYPCESRDDIAGKERVSPDKWHLEIQRPVFLAPRAQWIYEASAFAPNPVPASVSGWQPQTNQPLFDARRLQAIYPPDCRGDVPRSETILADKWHPLANQPQFDQKRQQQNYQCDALGAYPTPAQASGWQPQTNQPLYDQKRLQYFYPCESRDDIAGKERVSPDRWLGVDPPIYSARRQQAIYPSDFRGDVPRAETIYADKWHPEIQQPRFDVARTQQRYPQGQPVALATTPPVSGWQPQTNQPVFDARRLQAIYSCESRDDIAGKERVSIDKWHLEIQRPVYDARRQQQTYPDQAFSPLPIPAPASGWHPPIEQPRYDAKRQQQLYPDHVLRPLPIPPLVSAWHSEIQQPRFDQKRHQATYSTGILGDIPRLATLYLKSWQQTQEPRFDLKRQQYLYPALVADTVPRKEPVSLDRWHPSIERVLYDPRRAYRITNETSYADIPRNYIIGPDRWTPSAELPRVLARRTDPSIIQAFVVIPPPPITWVDGQVSQIPILPRFRPFDTPSGLGDVPRIERHSIDKWQPPLEQPLFAKPYFQWAYNPPPLPYLASIAPPAPRLQIIAPDVRIFPINPETRFALAGIGGLMQQYTHSQNEILDYGWDWSQWLEAIGDYIVTSIWIVPSGMNQSNASIVSGTSITSVFLQGNKLGAVYTITNRIVTGQGRTAEQSFKLTIGTV